MRTATALARPACWAAILLAWAAVAFADDPFEFRLKDGRVLVGEIKDFTGGVYTVRTAEDVVRIPERDIRTLAPAQALEASTHPNAPAVWQGQLAGWQGQLAGPIADAGEMDDRSAEAASALSQGTAELAAGHAPEARKTLERAKSLDPWSLPARLALARACDACGDAEACERELRQVLSIDAANGRGLAQLRALYERTGQREKLDALVEEAFRARYAPPEAAYRSTRWFLDAGDLDRARVHWKRYLAVRPDPRPDFDLEARIEQDADALAAAGRGQEAIAKLYDLMRQNPLERERVMSRVMEVHERSVVSLLASHEVARACDELGVMATFAPTRVASFRARALAACADEAARCMAASDAHDLRAFLAWLGTGVPTADAASAVASALDAPGAGEDALDATREFLSAQTDPAWAGARTKLVSVLSAALDGDTKADRLDRVVRRAEALEGLDPDHAADWHARRAAACRDLGLAEAKAGDLPAALSHLHAAQALLPDDASIASAIDDAEFQRVKGAVDGSTAAAEKKALLDEFLRGTHDDARGQWGREELGKIESVAKVERAACTRDRERYFPTAVGTTWTYAWSDGRQDQLKVVAADPVDDHTRVEIAVDSSVGSESTCHPLTIFASDAEAWIEREGRREVWFRFPIAAGQSWECRGAGITYRRTYLSLHESVQTRLKTFDDCLKVLYESVDASGSTMASELYYAPHVGLVKMTSPGGKGMEIVDFQESGGK